MQSYRKISNQNTRKSPAIEGMLFNCTGELGIDDFGCLNSSLALFLLCNEPAKIKKIGARTVIADSLVPSMRASVLLP